MRDSLRMRSLSSILNVDLLIDVKFVNFYEVELSIYKNIAFFCNLSFICEIMRFVLSAKISENAYTLFDLAKNDSLF